MFMIIGVTKNQSESQRVWTLRYKEAVLDTKAAAALLILFVSNFLNSVSSVTIALTDQLCHDRPCHDCPGHAVNKSVSLTKCKLLSIPVSPPVVLSYRCSS